MVILQFHSLPWKIVDIIIAKVMLGPPNFISVVLTN